MTIFKIMQAYAEFAAIVAKHNAENQCKVIPMPELHFLPLFHKKETKYVAVLRLEQSARYSDIFVLEKKNFTIEQVNDDADNIAVNCLDAIDANFEQFTANALSENELIHVAKVAARLALVDDIYGKVNHYI